MHKYYLDYVDAEGGRLANIARRHFDNLSEAQLEAAKIVSDFVRNGTPHTAGRVEIVDETGALVCDFRLPDDG